MYWLILASALMFLLAIFLQELTSKCRSSHPEVFWKYAANLQESSIIYEGIGEVSILFFYEEILHAKKA